MTPRQHIDAGWRLEAFAVMLWALGLMPALPDYGSQAGDELLKSFPPGRDPGFPSRASLRPAAELDSARGLAELWHWRSRTRRLVESGERLPPNPKMEAAGIRTFDDVIRISAQRTHQSGGIGKPIDGDFPVLGKAYRRLTSEEWATVTSITMERHRALNWLCGYAPGGDWDETPTDT